MTLQELLDAAKAAISDGESGAAPGSYAVTPSASSRSRSIAATMASTASMKTKISQRDCLRARSWCSKKFIPG